MLSRGNVASLCRIFITDLPATIFQERTDVGRYWPTNDNMSNGECIKIFARCEELYSSKIR